MSQIKPLNWEPTEGINYTAERRADGGMSITFTEMDNATMLHWREFALDHLVGSDQLTRNLYDLSAVSHIPNEAVQIAIEANSDPSTRNIRLAVVVSNETVKAGLLKIASLSMGPGGGSNMKVFTDLSKANEWLSRPLDTMT